MNKTSSEMLPGVRVHDLKKSIDERGFFAEIFRQDWKDLLLEDTVVQGNLSFSFPGMIRAWHRHNRGQVDYFIVVKGSMKICAYDDKHGSTTLGQIDEVVASEERLQVVRIPGHYWHGTKTVGDRPSLTIYCVNRLYDAKNPDEGRRPWNDPTIVDPKTSKAFDWNRLPHK
jgi:dTDP-4-dehydrorhamnose 3,5-epimerase